MFARCQQLFRPSGNKRILYSREYQIVGIDQVKSGKTRYRVVKELHITESMLWKWIIKHGEILAIRKGGQKAVSGRYVK